MKLIVGLGNPEPKYRQTLHNVGFEVVNAVAARHGVAFESAPADALLAKVRGMRRSGDAAPVEPGSDAGRDAVVLLAKPLTYMNLSGRAVGDLQRYYKIALDDLLVIVDDVNLPAGQLRARTGGSAGGHNGLKSIIECLGTDRFPRLRVGVGRGDARRDLRDHVLGRIPPDVQEILATAVATAADAVELFATGSLADVMNRFNRKPQSEADQAGAL